MQLHVQGETTNSKCESAIRCAALSRELLEKMRKDNDWTEEACNAVNWTAMGRALNKNDKHRKQLVKFVHKQLPTAKRVHECDKLAPPECPFGCGEIKDQEHA